MILKFFELEKKIFEKNKYFLFYGKNKGLIQETIQKKIEPLAVGKMHKYEESEIIKNKDDFIENLKNKSFFDKEKFIIIHRATDKLFKIIEDIVEKNFEDIFLLLICGELEKKSKLRNYFEKSKKTVCIPFYEDNLKTLSLLAYSFLKEKKINISQHDINFFVERCRGDRINLYNELEKIHNFSRNKKKITLDEITKLTNLSENFDLNELVDYTLAKNQKKTMNILNENNFVSEDTILILRIFIRKLKRLLKIHLHNKKEKNIEKVISLFKPPIFWKEKDIVKEQLKILSHNKIQNLLVEVNKIELLVKKYPSNSINLVTDFLLQQSQIVNN